MHKSYEAELKTLGERAAGKAVAGTAAVGGGAGSDDLAAWQAREAQAVQRAKTYEGALASAKEHIAQLEASSEGLASSAAFEDSRRRASELQGELRTTKLELTRVSKALDKRDVEAASLEA